MICHIRFLILILLQDCAKHGWPNYQFADATGAAYQNLYRNKNGNLLFHLTCTNIMTLYKF